MTIGFGPARPERRRGLGAVLAGTAALAAMVAGCAAPAPPPPPPPPAYVPPPPVRPAPPLGASVGMVVPLTGPDGIRRTINTGISTAARLWHLRAALNVAALNCLQPQHLVIGDNYNRFLKTHARPLAAANTAMEKEFRSLHGATGPRVRDTHMTQVYNFFALPPVLGRFCDAALPVSNEIVAVPAKELDLYAAQALPRIESEFDSFFGAYEQYLRDVAAWDLQYGPPGARLQPAGAAQPLNAPLTVPAPAYGPSASPGGGPATGPAPALPTGPAPALPTGYVPSVPAGTAGGPGGNPQR